MLQSGPPERRRYPRRKVFIFCRVVWASQQSSYQVPGMIVNVSRKGLAILLRHPAQPIWMEGTVYIPNDIELLAAPVHKQTWEERVTGYQVGFAMKRIVSGERQWEALCDALGGMQPVIPQA